MSLIYLFAPAPGAARRAVTASESRPDPGMDSGPFAAALWTGRICLLTLHILCIYSLRPVRLRYGYFFKRPTKGSLDQFPTCIAVSIPNYWRRA